MDSAPQLTGETLIVHHIPLVHCQVPDRQCCGASQRTNPFGQSELGAARTSCLSERDLSQADSLGFSSLLQASEPGPASAETPEDRGRRQLAAPKRHNPFQRSQSEAQELGEDEPGQKSFHLHPGQSASHLQALMPPPFHLHDAAKAGLKPWSAASRLDVAEGQEEQLTGEEARKRSRLAPECMELDEYSCQGGDPASLSFEQEWASEADELMANPEEGRSRMCSCSSSELQRCRCSSLSSQSEPPGYISDSSCNSSDGVLVNFSALYHKMNGHSHAHRSCTSSSSGSHSETGAFYLDLHSSPTTDAKMPCGSGQACGCHGAASPVLDANCNSCPPLCEPCASEGSDLTACFQSQARLVVATQNYYKLVTCDLSSQSSPSPAGSSITSCSEEHGKGSPLQPTEYYLFQRPESDSEGSREESQGEAAREAIEGQVYVNISPPTLAGGRQRSRSYDRNLDRSPTSRLGSLERMLSCPVQLSDSPALALQSSPPKRVTSFAELAKGRKKNGSSPPLRASRDSSLEFSPIPECQKDSGAFLDKRGPGHSQSLPPLPLLHSLHRSCEGYHHHAEGGLNTSGRGTPSCGEGGLEQPFLSAWVEAGTGPAGGLGQKDVRARADGGAGGHKAVVRYSKDQRPTTLPIQPFVFQHHFPRQPKARALHSHLASSLSQLYSRSGGQPLSSTSQSSASASSAEQPMVVVVGHSQRSADGAAAKKPGPETARPSPLGSYSPVRSHCVPSFPSADSSSGSPSPESSQPPRSRSCPASANLLPTRPSPATRADTLPRREEESPPQLAPKQEGLTQGPAALPAACQLHGGSGGLSMTTAGGQPEPHWKVGCSEAISTGTTTGTILSRPLNANHLSPQALKWREYRRRNPLGLDRVSGLACSLDWKPQESRLPWRNPIFDFPSTALNGGRASCRLNGQSVKQLQLNYSDFFPDYFSLAEKPPAEFCLSPDGNTESISIDLLQKKGLVKAINMAVDLIVVHFGTSRDPGVKAKLGNSSVSPNVGHLILKYLCPAIRDVLSDGLKAYVLDVIIGQRRNLPWSVVEASTQLGPSTKVLHSLYSKVSQYPELSSHTMRFNAFVFGLLNVRSLEFWFNHLYNHEDVIQAHYQPVGFLPLAHGVCQGLFEEVLLLLQPLSLLPFDLDLLFEHQLQQMGREQQQQKALLRGKQDLVLSAHSTLQLMRTRGGGSSGGGGGSWEAEQEPVPEKAAQAERAKGLGGPEAEAAAAEQQQRRWKAAREKEKQASWWFQLMQSSQVYIEGPAEGSRLIHCERKKKAGAKKGPPPREGVVEGAEAGPISEVPVQNRPPPVEAAEPAPWRPEPSAKDGAKEKSRPFWMGSPPDSVLTELKRTKQKEAGPSRQQQGLEERSASAPESSQPKWGHLFGSRKMPKDSKQPNRLPSGWLSLDRSVFQLMAQTVGAAGVWREAASEPERLPAAAEPLPPWPQQPPPGRGVSLETPREVKALCHHIATEAGQLSFKKGDVLRVLAKVDADWLRCSRGGRGGGESGLVPIMYVAHMEDEDY
ncbi:AP-4 complex accessory subunit RUSC2-like [Hemicordylus capensis]|uniref:AP-4 complex accessory subunit RUSC2-like n=1 Tax=Hemicordylus capensis TaxID=884348 RepID=UPI002302A4C5|nr:AP-4 complex accessory subunit RUSC2-like [Hemicordylus capensis]XP_053152169.1 AP-4 complex accessory subunit RUSC2-like [Hemicordylus capensis]XP_053152170.1 AP-4 complex accessory subunit RUSC2-like [Hemicordylus capensis]XP_053152171.1 AP-4 complex accessory subunit RUSC2-like [Hemicordylus capensis]